MDPLTELRKRYPDIKIHRNDEYNTYTILGQRETPFWTAFFESELDALIAWDYFTTAMHRLTAEKEDMKARNRALRKERASLLAKHYQFLTNGPRAKE